MWLVRPPLSVIGMRAMMRIARRPLSRHQRHSRQHPLILRDAVMEMVRMPRSATVWMSDHVLERRTATGWILTIRMSANRPRPPLLLRPHTLRDAVPDILREHSRSAMHSKMAMTANQLECAHGFPPMIPMNASRPPRPQRLPRRPSTPLVAALETHREHGRSARALTKC